MHQRSTAEFANATNGYEITQVQLSILLAVADYPGIDATRISDLIGTDRATIGQALLRLEQKRLIRRRTGRLDKRTKRLVITDEGRRLAESVAHLVPAVGPAILQGLSPEEQEVFLRLLTKIVAENEGDKAVGIGVPPPQSQAPQAATRRRRAPGAVQPPA